MSDDPVGDLLALEAEEREKQHIGQATYRPLSSGKEVVGLAGEVEFGRVFNQPVNWERLLGGDSGVDFTVPLGFTVDVKSARKATYLLVEPGKVVADIYVLAEYSDVLRRATLLGWEYGSVVARAPIEDKGGMGIASHAIHRDDLRAMSDLGRRIMRLTINGRGP